MILRHLPRLLPRTPLSLQYQPAFSDVRYSFCTLRSKVNNASNLQQYLQLFHSEQNYFTQQVALGSLSIFIQLLEKERKINIKSMNKYISFLESIEMSGCSSEDLKRLLRIVDKFEESRDVQTINKPWSNLKKNIGNHLLLLLQNKEHQAQDLSHLLQYLSFLTSQDQNYVFYTLQLKILRIIDNKTIKIPKQLIYKYFQILSKKLYLQTLDKKLFDIFIFQLQPEIKKMPLQQLLDFCIVLNKIDHFYFQRTERNIISRIFSLLADQIQNLEEEEVQRLISEPQHPLNFNNLTQSYIKVQNLLFDQIAENGSTSVNTDFVFMIFSNLVKKRAIFKIPAKNQQKFFQFIQLYLKQVESRSPQEYQSVTYNISLMIQHKFIAQKQQLYELLTLFGKNTHTHLLYILSVRGYEVDHIIPHNTVDMKNHNYAQIVKRAIVLKRSLLSKQNQSFQKELNSIEEYLQQMLKDEYLSKKLLSSILKEDPTKTFNNIFFELFSKQLLQNIKNPFQQKCNDQYYLLAYCQFILSCKNSTLKQRKKQIQKNINEFNLFKIISQQLNKMEYMDVPPQSQLLNLINNTFTELAISSNFIYGKLFSFLGRVIRYVVHDQLDHITKELFWSIIFKILAFCKSGEYKKIDNRIQTLLSNILTVQHTPFKISPKFKAFVARIADHFQVFKNILQINVIKEVLSLNIKNQHIINKIIPQNVKKLPWELRQKHKILSDPKHIPTFSESKLMDALDLIVLRPEFDKIIVSNKQMILKKVESMKFSVLLSTLCSNQLPNSSINRQLIKILTKEMMKRIKHFDQVDYQSILSKCQSNYSFQLSCFSELFNKIIMFYQENQEKRNKFYQLDPEVVYQLSKFMSTQPSTLIQKKDQFYELAQNYIKKASFTSKPMVLTGLLFTSFPYKAEHLKYIWKIFEANFIYGLRFFITLEEKYDEKTQKIIVSRIAQILGKNIQKGGRNNIKRQTYLYLKSKYPQEMQNISIDESKLEPYMFSNKPNSHIFHALTQACRVLDLKMNIQQQFLPNTVYELDNKYIIFNSPLKTSAEYEKRLNKKILKVVSKRNIPVFDFTNDITSQQKYLELITKEGLLFSIDQTKVLRQKLNFSDMKMKTKAGNSAKGQMFSRKKEQQI